MVLNFLLGLRYVAYSLSLFISCFHFSPMEDCLPSIAEFECLANSGCEGCNIKEQDFQNLFNFFLKFSRLFCCSHGEPHF